MPQYQRQTGTRDVYDVSGATPRYISFEEAQRGNIWGEVKDVPQVGQAPTLGGQVASGLSQFLPKTTLTEEQKTIMEQFGERRKAAETFFEH